VGNIGLEHVFKVNRIPLNDNTGLILQEKMYFGGRAGNIALILARLGLKVAIASFVGRDFIESGYRDFLIRNHVNIDKIKVIAHKKCTRTVVLYTEKAELVYFFEPILRSSPSILDLSKNDVESCSILYMTSFDGEKPIRRLTELTRDTQNIIVVALGEEVYRKSRNFLESLVSAADYLFANQAEIEILFGKIGLSSVTDLFEKNERLKCIAITSGQHGSILHARDAIHKIQPVFPSRIVNALGAGDAYVAGFIYGLQKRFDIQKCGKIASVIASFALEVEGAQPSSISLQDVKMRYSKAFQQFKMKNG